MKSFFTERLNRYLLLVLAFLPAFIIIRVAEGLSLIFQHSLTETIWLMEIHGLMLDGLVFFSFALLCFVLYILVSLLHRKAGTILAMILFMLFVLVSMALTAYFTKTLVPLDQVIFFFTPYESYRIIVSSTRVDFAGMTFFILVFAVPLILYFRIHKILIKKVFRFILTAILFLSPLSLIFLMPDQSRYNNNFEYFVRCNKVDYMAGKVYSFMIMKNRLDMTDRSYDAAVKRYHARNPEFTYISDKYPLLRIDRTPDVLGQFFTFGQEKPNIVFIVVESLSSAFCGDNPYYGSYTPFLDSLIGKSLYWKNCLSTSERTFNVLPAMFGSLPFSHEVFRFPQAPLHFSLIRYLNENDYFSSYYYGGDPYMGGTQTFLEHEQINYILPYFGKSQEEKEKEKLFEWGDFDGVMFSRAFRALDSINPASPRLDIYQTLTTHAPFTTPEDKHYKKLLEERVKTLNLRPDIRRMILLQENIFSTILYTDESLREFFNYYSKRKDFGNTIFIITGDHSMPELSYNFMNVLEKYHVPLIIYSPMLKKPEAFQAITSHLDITPSILAMLKNQGFIKIRAVCTWLGEGLDITKAFQNKRTVSFILNSRNQDEYIRDNYFISFHRLFRVLPDEKIALLNNPGILNDLENEQQDYLAITDRIKDRQSLIPDRFLIYENYSGEPYHFTKPASCKKSTTDKEFFSLIEDRKIGKDYKIISLELSLLTGNKGKDTSFIPNLVFQVLDDKSNNILWLRFPFRNDSVVTKDNFIYLRKLIDLSDINDISSKVLKIYLYNPDHKQFSVDSINLVLKGYTYRKE